MTETTYRQKVDALPSSREVDAVIASAVENAQDLGLDEADDAFWASVFGEVIETLSPEMA